MQVKADCRHNDDGDDNVWAGLKLQNSAFHCCAQRKHALAPFGCGAIIVTTIMSCFMLCLQRLHLAQASWCHACQEAGTALQPHMPLK